MQIALGVPRLTADWQTNAAEMCKMTASAAQAGATLVMFSEAAVTGLVNTGTPQHDLALGQPVPGPATKTLADAARLHQVWVAFGLFECEYNSLYDTAVLIAPDGSLFSKYRRIDPHWHHWHSRPCCDMIYGQGTQPASFETPLGTGAFLLCGDLFNETCVEQLAGLNVEWLLLPMARCFDQDAGAVERWHQQEKYFYVHQAQKAGVHLLLVNQLANIEGDRYFGGALIASSDGHILAEYPLEQEGLLVVETIDFKLKTID